MHMDICCFRPSLNYPHVYFASIWWIRVQARGNGLLPSEVSTGEGKALCDLTAAQSQLLEAVWHATSRAVCVSWHIRSSKDSRQQRSGVFSPSPVTLSCSLRLKKSLFYITYVIQTYIFCIDTWMMHWITHNKLMLKPYKQTRGCEKKNGSLGKYFVLVSLLKMLDGNYPVWSRRLPAIASGVDRFHCSDQTFFCQTLTLKWPWSLSFHLGDC